MRILELRAIRGWSVHQTAARFLVTEETIVSWSRRLEEEGGFIRVLSEYSAGSQLGKGQFLATA